jgi:hypothetical protein
MKTYAFKVDTGANCTTIGRDTLNALGFDDEWIKQGKPMRPSVASGIVIEDCYEVILPEIRIGDWVGYNWPFLTGLSAKFRFLLGTDSMKFFKWYFDYECDICEFDIIRGKQRMLFNQAVQVIHELDESED